MDCNPPGFFVYEIFQARVLEQVAISLPGDFPDLGIETVSLMSPASGRLYTTSTTNETLNIPGAATRAQLLGPVLLFKAPCTITLQALLSMEFPRQDTGTGCHYLLQGIFLIQR